MPEVFLVVTRPAWCFGFSGNLRRHLAAERRVPRDMRHLPETQRVQWEKNGYLAETQARSF